LRLDLDQRCDLGPGLAQKRGEVGADRDLAEADEGDANGRRSH
jgi:hypothetical protein